MRFWRPASCAGRSGLLVFETVPEEPSLLARSHGSEPGQTSVGDPPSLLQNRVACHARIAPAAWTAT